MFQFHMEIQCYASVHIDSLETFAFMDGGSDQPFCKHTEMDSTSPRRRGVFSLVVRCVGRVCVERKGLSTGCRPSNLLPLSLKRLRNSIPARRRGFTLEPGRVCSDALCVSKTEHHSHCPLE